MIYVRQSSAGAGPRAHRVDRPAVRAGRAGRRAGLGPRDVAVIDADLGVSGRSTEGRDGFRALVARVCLGEVGAIFGLEISRLARSSADLSRLLELARLTDTLLIDGDGVYDLTDFNDRLLLGLKGTMSEAELHLLAGRLQGAKRAAAARGELRTPLPVGYLHDDQGATVIDPDEEVAAAIADVFTAFTATGSAYQVVAAFTGRRFPLRAYGGAWAGQLRWGRLNHARVLGILNNPCYAGAYVFGRYASPPHRRTRRQRSTPGSPCSRRTVAGPDPRPPPRLHQLGGLPGQPGKVRRQPHPHRRPPGPRRPRVVSGHHHLRQLRTADVDAVSPQRHRRLRMPRRREDQRPPRPAGR